jgi:hypothetical protein
MLSHWLTAISGGDHGDLASCTDATEMTSKSWRFPTSNIQDPLVFIINKNLEAFRPHQKRGLADSPQFNPMDTTSLT